MKNKVKQYHLSQMNELCREIREKILATVKKRGGHLSSNLGVVELTVALHHVFDFPKDKIVFDVGHQCYAHKILSDREEAFDTLRTRGGISGFPKRSESEYDAYDTGHAGTSVSAALGLAKARDLNGDSYAVVAMIGDGSFQNGLIYEALNSISILNTHILIVVNDNDMSISPTMGSVHEQLSADEGKNGLPFYEQFGLKYLGVYDGNDLAECVDKLTLAKEELKNSSVLIHFKTVKGKGYPFAENAPLVTHGLSPKDREVRQNYSSVLGEELSEIFRQEENAVAVTAAMTDSLGLRELFTAYPERCFDVGICEEHACVLSASLAAAGKKPYFAIYSTFLQRAYDEVIHDVCGQDLPVTFCIDRGGISGSDGETHQGIFDLSYLSCIPNLTIAIPSSLTEFRDMLRWSRKFPHPLAIRYPKEGKESPTRLFCLEKFPSWREISPPRKVTILAAGERCIELAEKVAKKLPFEIGIVNARFLSPLDENYLGGIPSRYIVTLEDNMVGGGLGGKVAQFYAHTEKKVYSFGYRRFIPHGEVEELMEEFGLNCDEIVACIGRLHESG